MMTELETQLAQISHELVSVRAQLGDAEATVERLRAHKLRLEGGIIALSRLKERPALAADNPCEGS